MRARPPSFDARGDTPGPSDADGRSRGQTTLDFAVGISLFLLTMAFVVSFVPGILGPFESGPQEETVVADRIANQLGQSMLGDPAEPYVLDVDCTTEFFDPEPAGSRNANGCRYDESLDLTGSATLNELLGLAPRQNVNVTIRGDPDGDDTTELLCFDDSAQALVSASSCSGSDDQRYGIGGDPSGAESVISARRIVSVGGVEGTLVVRAW
ncbi:DUF7287 family protein [Haloglomus litoreum]|uniref:DUF7287 family protein n=1 Tax=Haloglomus litoreum TaxID=3034026 RepID=UPI0023E82087|nr:hypothetical protein [Haloglomus sp. DT116]